MQAIVVTGGAGFVGCNLVARLIELGYKPIIFDNLSRPGVEKNLQWLQNSWPNNFEFVKGDVRNLDLLTEVVKEAEIIYHLAAQVAVTTSVENPVEDFDINARGSLNVLEAARKSKNKPRVIFTSTNKVYGKLAQLPVIEKGNRYEFKSLAAGINEEQPLDFYSPYGCSKGVADQYVRDYARCYDLPTVVLRMSCQYGPHQFGNEDQGWVAHFAISAILQRPITIYGDGKQVRDVLYIDDLVDALVLTIEKGRELSGQVFNIGGGPENSISLLELIDLLQELEGNKIALQFAPWRVGDQLVFVTDITKAREKLDWRPKTNTLQGLNKLVSWIKENIQLIKS